MIKFKYNRKIDEYCWQRIIGAGSIYNTEVPKKVDIDNEKIKKAKGKIKFFQEEFASVENEFKKQIKKMFKTFFPENMNIYINTTSYSMDDYENRCLCISYERDINFITSFMHEANHYMFRKKYEKTCRIQGFTQEEIEDIKEIMTVVNNIAFANLIKTPDFGWEKHKLLRRKVYKIYKNNNDFKQTLSKLMCILKKENY